MDKFLKCDMHLHSSSCYSRNYNESSFIKTMKDSDLDVFSITDHNVIDVELYKKLSTMITDKDIIGGVELNIAIDCEEIEKRKLTVSSNYFHGIIWFDLIDLDLSWHSLKSLIQDKLGIDTENKTIKEISKLTEGKYFYLKDVQKYFKDFNYYLIFHEGKSDRNLSDYLKNNTVENQNYKHDLFYYNNKFAIEGGMKTRPISQYFEDNLNTIVSRFFFSDAVSLSDIGDKFTWINFDGNFESLILAFSDPKVRVFTSDEIGNNYPQNNIDKYLESIKIEFKKDDGQLYIEELFFTPSFNGIIGSRGSGKTLLGNVLGNVDITNYDKFINSDTIKYKLVGEGYKSSSPNSKYLKQNSLLEVFKNNEVKDIDFIKPLFEKQENDKRLLINSFIYKISKLLKNEKNMFYSLIEKNYNVLEDINFIEDNINLDYMIEKFNDEDLIDGNKLSEKIMLAITNLSKRLEEDLNELEKIPKIDLSYKELKPHNKLVENFKKDYIKLVNEKADLIINTLEELDKIDSSDIDIRKSLVESLKQLIIETNKNTSVSASNVVDNTENAINQLIEITKLRTIFSETTKIIEDLIRELKQETKSDSETINENETIVVSTSLESFKTYEEHFKHYFKEYKNKSYEFHMINVFMAYNDINLLKGYFDGNKFRSLSNAKSFIDNYYDKLTEDLKKVEDFKVKIYHNENDIETYSPGKKSEVLLDIFLHEKILEQDYVYIILDQPEDNIDTKTITEKLISRVRNMKRDVQFFIISHSAAVIINGDAENIIYSYEDGKDIRYKQGRIIDDNIKENIVDTLDGGEKNLKMRLNKYDFDKGVK